jgi:hypothetical protein
MEEHGYRRIYGQYPGAARSRKACVAEVETDNDDERTTSADADGAVPVFRTKAKPNRSRDAWVKNLETTTLSASDIADIQRGHGKALPTLGVETVRSYFVAIKRQDFVNARPLPIEYLKNLEVFNDESSEAFIPARHDTISMTTSASSSLTTSK